MNDYIVETEKLTKRFGERVAVDAVDLRIPRGSAFGYLGPNGAGKTTLIRMLLGLTSASSGSMRLLGRPVPAEREDALARVGAIVEEPRFHPFLTGRENLEIIAAARDAAAFDRIEGALDLVGLAARADERVKRYSLGMRQRLGVARALLGDPELLILEEPSTASIPRASSSSGASSGASSARDEQSCSRRICSTRWRRSATSLRSSTVATSSGRARSTRSRRRASTVLVAVDDDPAALGLLGDTVEVTPDGLLVALPAGAAASRRRDQPEARGGGRRRPSPRAFPRLARGAVPGDHVTTGGSSMNLIRAEFLKLRKRRGLVAATALVTIAPVAIATPSSRSCTRRGLRVRRGRRIDNFTGRST